MFRILFYFIVLLFTAFLWSCNEPAREGRTQSRNELREPLMEANKHAVKTESQHIEDFLRRYKWDVQETGSGLRYMVYKKGEGQAARKGDIVVLEYTASFITGDVVYSSDEEGLLIFEVGKAEVISGLEEGILLLRVGDKAKFIIPSHLAYGLVGDDKRIPGKTTLIYDVTLLEINRSY